MERFTDIRLLKRGPLLKIFDTNRSFTFNEQSIEKIKETCDDFTNRELERQTRENAIIMAIATHEKNLSRSLKKEAKAFVNS